MGGEGTRADWSRAEVEAIVADYLDMFAKELRRERYSKTAHRRALGRLLNRRSDGSIERKHQNISAILIELGCPYISGYKPLGNYQTLLYEVVAQRLMAERRLQQLVAGNVDLPAVVPTVEDILARLESPPAPPAKNYDRLTERPRPATKAWAPIDYLARESSNASLGRAGEEFTLNFERARLIRLGRTVLADRVEHVAITRGEGAGFDVLSFEESGRDRYIEVKTTAYGKATPFFVTRNEVSVSGAYDRSYHLYRLFNFRQDPRLYSLSGALERTCALWPVTFVARMS